MIVVYLEMIYYGLGREDSKETVADECENVKNRW
jgi:hypothetical protein